MKFVDKFQTCFCFFKKKIISTKKQVVSMLVSTYFGNPRLGYTIKTNCIKIQTVDPEIWSILIFEKRVCN